MLIAAGRALLTRAYARTYRTGSRPSDRHDAWLVVHMAARLSEGITAEQDMLTGRLDRAWRTAAHTS